MKKKPAYKYYWLGICFRYLQDVRRGYRIHGQGRVLYNVDAFLDYVSTLDLVVTDRAAGELAEFKESISQAAADARLTDEHASRLRSLITEIGRTLDAEIEGFETVVITPKRLGVQKLLENLPAFLTPGVFEELPDMAQRDLSEAGKCIVFERPTAAAFHIFRGTESVLRDFYCSLVSKKRVKKLLWGPMVADLRKKQGAKNRVSLYNKLEKIHLSFSDPRQYPSRFYDIHEVQNLWSLCCEVINSMLIQPTRGR